MREVRCQGRRGREEQRATLLPLGGRGALRDETKTPAWDTSSSAVGEVYIYYQPILGKQTIPQLEYQAYLWGRGGRRREKKKEEIPNFSLP